MSNIIELEATDLTGLGGPMGTERVSTVFRKHFPTVMAAMIYAEDHYNGSRGPISWLQKGKDRMTSGDLGYIMYEIRPITLEG